MVGRESTRSGGTVRRIEPRGRRSFGIAGDARRAWLILAVLAIGCAGGAPLVENTPPDAEDLWGRAESARLAGRDSEAADLYATFYRHHYRDPRAAEALLNAGVAHRRAGEPTSARSHLITAAGLGDDRITPHAQLQLGYLERGEGQYAAAAMRFEDAARSARDVETRAEALLEAGISLQRAGAFEEATRPLRACLDLAEVAPRFAEEAREVLARDPSFTVQVGAFARRSHATERSAALVGAGFPAEVRASDATGTSLYLSLIHI